MKILAGCYNLVFLLSCLCASCVSCPKPILPIPEAKQVQWQQMETYAFVHFGLNTFTDKEWGYGDADPALFNPSDLDCEQWVQTFVKAGMKGVILTAKHHDGFCLWPTKYTDYSVKSSPWKNGKGDVVGDLAAACKKYGIKMGVYLSPWDRHQSNYGSPEYVEHYHNQLIELLSNYGDFFELWFDGANGGDGWYGGANEVRSIDRRTYYNFPKIHAIIDSLQPHAVIFSDGGPGCHWVGNESGVAGETNWSFLIKDKVYPGYKNFAELQFGHADGDQWTAAECDVSTRPGWFYHTSEDSQVKSVDYLTNLYYKSVGRNATFLLNFPVDRTGKINAIDSTNAVQWHQCIKREFANNILAGVVPKASAIRGGKFGEKNITDNNYDTYWATPDKVNTASLTFNLKKEQPVNCVLIQEYIPLGQRVKSFNIEVKYNGAWLPVSVGEETTTIGYKRILRFPDVVTNQIRINFTDSRGPLVINNVEAYHVQEKTEDNSSDKVEKQGFAFSLIGIPEKEASKANDGDSKTTCRINGHSVIFDLGGKREFLGLDYLPDQAKYAHGMISSYELYTCDELGHPEKLLAKGEFSNIKNNPIWQKITFNPITSRYLLLKAIRTVNDDSGVSIAECIIY